MVRRPRLERALIVLGLLVAACSAPPAPAPTSPPATAGSQAVATSAVQATPAKPAGQVAAPVASGQSKPSGPAPAFRLPIAEPPTLDPGLASDAASMDVIVQVFEGLVTFDDKGTISGLGAEKWE